MLIVKCLCLFWIKAQYEWLMQNIVWIMNYEWCAVARSCGVLMSHYALIVSYANKTVTLNCNEKAVYPLAPALAGMRFRLAGQGLAFSLLRDGRKCVGFSV